MLPAALAPHALPLLLLQGTTGEPQSAPSSSPFGGDFWLPLVAIVVVFWFVMIGPERKNRKRREEMLAALKKGDRVMTTSGIYGTVVQVQGSVVTLAISENVRVRFSLQAIQGLEEERPETPPATPAKT